MYDVPNFSGFCYCGLYTITKDGKDWCRRHKFEVTKEKRVKIGDYSGPSKSPNKFNDYKE